MRQDRDLATKLRVQKKSYNEISQLLNIPKSTLSYWFKKSTASKRIKKELQEKNHDRARKQLVLMSAANKKKWEKWRRDFQIEAREEFPSLRDNPLFICAISLYWGEGDSILKNNIVRLANSDYRMIKIFNIFLRNICNVPEEKIKISLFLYRDLDIEECKKFWSHGSKIALSQFNKPQIIIGKHPTKRLSHGVCSIQVYSRGLKEKIVVWTDLLAASGLI